MIRSDNKEDNGILDERDDMPQEADEKNMGTRGKFRGKILWDVRYFSFLGLIIKWSQGALTTTTAKLVNQDILTNVLSFGNQIF